MRIRWWTLFFGALMWACGGDVTGPGAVTEDDPVDPPILGVPRLEIVAGDNQTSEVATRLSTELHARVLRDSSGVSVAVPEMLVEWHVLTEGGGEPFLTTTQTTAEGDVRNFWDLGTKAGLHEMEVRAFLDGNPVSVVVFNAEATPGPAVLLDFAIDSFPLWVGNGFSISDNLTSFDQYGNETDPSALTIQTPTGFVGRNDSIVAIGEGVGKVFYTDGTAKDSTEVSALYDFSSYSWTVPDTVIDTSSGDDTVSMHNVQVDNVVLIERKWGTATWEFSLSGWEDYSYDGLPPFQFPTGERQWDWAVHHGILGVAQSVGRVEWFETGGRCDPGSVGNCPTGIAPLVSEAPLTYVGGKWHDQQDNWVSVKAPRLMGRSLGI